MIILQRVKVARQITTDGGYTITAPIGEELLIQPTTIQFRPSRKGKSYLAAKIEDTEYWIPVELLDFSPNEFIVKE